MNALKRFDSNADKWFASEQEQRVEAWAAGHAQVLLRQQQRLGEAQHREQRRAHAEHAQRHQQQQQARVAPGAVLLLEEPGHVS